MSIEGTSAPRLGRTAAWLAKQVEIALTGVELSPAQYRVLGLLGDSASLVSSKLASDLAVRPPSVTAIIDGLVARGLVSRGPSDGDRRRVSHELTSGGRALLEHADAAVEGRLADIAGSLESSEDAERALTGLALWRPALTAYRMATSVGR